MPTSTSPTLTPTSNTRSCHANWWPATDLANVLGDLPRLVERAAGEQHRELVAADARDGVGVAHALFEQRRDLAQQIVAGDVPARVVDELEAIEIEIADDVADAFAARRVERRSRGAARTPHD